MSRKATAVAARQMAALRELEHVGEEEAQVLRMSVSTMARILRGCGGANALATRTTTHAWSRRTPPSRANTFGYERIDRFELKKDMDALCAKISLYNNLFRPCM